MLLKLKLSICAEIHSKIHPPTNFSNIENKLCSFSLHDHVVKN